MIASAAGFEAAAGAGGCGVVPALASLLGGLPAEGELFSGRAAVAVVVGIVAEVFFAEEAQGGVGGGVGFGDVGGDARFEAGFDLLAVVIAHIGEHIEAVHAERLLGAQGHHAEQALFGDRVGQLVVDDELVLGIDGHLEVIADIGDPAAADGHAAALGIGEGDLGFAAFIHALLQAFVLLHALLEQPDLLLELLGGELRLFGFFGVVGIQV